MKVIALSEIRIEKGEYVDQMCIVNPDHIVSAHRGLMEKPGPHLIGSEHARELTQVSLSGKNPIFVNESIEEIAILIAKRESTNRNFAEIPTEIAEVIKKNQA